MHTCADTYLPFFFWRMIEDAEERGLISPGVTTLVEPTSGNMGLGLVLFAIQKGYRLIAVMPAKYSLDKQILLRFMGAELHLTGTISWRKLWHHLNCLFSVIFPWLRNFMGDLLPLGVTYMQIRPLVFRACLTKLNSSENNCQMYMFWIKLRIKQILKPTSDWPVWIEYVFKSCLYLGKQELAAVLFMYGYNRS